MSQPSYPDLEEYPPLPRGTRVRVRGKPVGVTLRSGTGFVVGPAAVDGYYLVRLDAPAIYHHTSGDDEEITEIVDAVDNLEILSAGH